MSLNIAVRYPETPPATLDEVNALKRHENALREKLVMLTMSSCEVYEWLLDESVKSQRYFSLRARPLGKEIFSCGIVKIQQSAPEEMIEAIAVALKKQDVD